jgi:hypothetical protein
MSSSLAYLWSKLHLGATWALCPQPLLPGPLDSALVPGSVFCRTLPRGPISETHFPIDIPGTQLCVSVTYLQNHKEWLPGTGTHALPGAWDGLFVGLKM